MSFATTTKLLIFALIALDVVFRAAFVVLYCAAAYALMDPSLLRTLVIALHALLLIIAILLFWLCLSAKARARPCTTHNDFLLANGLAHLNRLHLALVSWLALLVLESLLSRLALDECGGDVLSDSVAPRTRHL